MTLIHAVPQQAGQSEHSGLIRRGAFKRQELKLAIRDKGYTEELQKGPLKL